MKTIDNIQKMAMLVRIWKKESKTIGFIPTMGYLHDGHLSLVKAAKQHTDVVVVSIFINPKQFAAGEDFDRYPRDLKRDEELARGSGTEILFCPSTEDMYPKGYATYVEVEKLGETLCGASRPGHFRAVTTVVAKLFGIVKPDIAYFGQKDAQQAIIIRKMVEDLNMGLDVKVLPTVREKDGLAMSSRNTYLSESERKEATVLYDSLRKADNMIGQGDRSAKKILKAMEEMIQARPNVKVDYISVIDTQELNPVDTISKETLIAVAAYVGKTRLIDNVIVAPHSDYVGIGLGNKAKGIYRNGSQRQKRF